jgi:hypothetical protein
VKAHEISLPDELDERLKAWARYFKDRHKYERCKSLEGHFEAASPGSWDEGWGSQDEIPPQPVAPALDLHSVLATHAAVMELDKQHKWAVTYGYCYPGMERWRVLKFIRKYTGHRLTWKEYLETLDIARIRVWARVSNI